jgi:hypothetical protein
LAAFEPVETGCICGREPRVTVERARWHEDALRVVLDAWHLRIRSIEQKGAALCERRTATVPIFLGALAPVEGGRGARDD